MKTAVKHVIFDLDGTLYRLDSDSFGTSSIGRDVRKHHITLLSSVTDDPEGLLGELCDAERNKNIPVSIGVANLIGKTRQYVFEHTWWLLKPEEVILSDKVDPDFLQGLRSRGIYLTLLTAGPEIWANKALEYLSIKTLFDAVITADMYSDGKKRGFRDVLFSSKSKPGTVVSIGDQEHSDIVPARNLGMQTHLVSGPKDIYTFFD